jgi:chromate reductase, NAD(P)H dehydrogenase (quinone)
MSAAASQEAEATLPDTRLLFFAGSSRTGSLNRKLATYAHRLAVEKGHAADLIELRDYPLPVYNADLQNSEGIPENARKLKALLGGYQGILIASPEYNASVPAMLKNTLDWLSRIRDEGEQPLQVFKTRVFAISSASPSMHGGARGLIALRQVLAIGLQALVLGDQFAVSKANEAFDEAGNAKDEIVRKTMAGIIDRLAFTAARFQP